MKKRMALILALVCLLCLPACKTESKPERETVSGFSAATFEYKEDDGYKLITGEIASLYTLDGLALAQTDKEFSGEWVYRIVFNPSHYVQNAEEFVVLFGESNVSINGKVYEGDGCPYDEILNWAAAKYEFFDYELISD